MDWPVCPPFQVFRQDNTGAGIVAAVQPQLPIRRQKPRETSVQALQPSGPFSMGDAGGAVREGGGAESGDRDSGVVQLEPAAQRRHGAFDYAGAIGIAKSRPAGADVPVPATQSDRGSQAAGMVEQDATDVRRLR